MGHDLFFKDMMGLELVHTINDQVGVDVHIPTIHDTFTSFPITSISFIKNNPMFMFDL